MRAHALLFVVSIAATGCADERPPSFDPAAGLVFTIGSDSVEVSWPPATDDRAVVAYVLEVDGVERSRVTEPRGEIPHGAELTSRTVAVRALDAAGNTSAPIEGEVTMPDRTAPTFPPNARVELTPGERDDGSLVLAWIAATDASGPVRYEVRSGELVAARVDEPRVELAVDVAPPGSSLDVVAIDASGLCSDPLRISADALDEVRRSVQARREAIAGVERLLRDALGSDGDALFGASADASH